MGWREAIQSITGRIGWADGSVQPPTASLPSRGKYSAIPGAPLITSLWLDELQPLFKKTMKTNSPAPEVYAFTRLELAVVLAVMALLTLILLPALAQVGSDAKRMACVNNLKLTGLELARWFTTRGDLYPMAVPAAKGGTKELVEGGNAFRHFQVIGNNERAEDPKILICPADTRHPAKRFDELQNASLSYFIGLDVKDRESRPMMFLSGDRNITNGLAPVKSILKLPPTRPAGWIETMHNGQGNVCLADGAVQRFTVESLRKSLKFTGDATNRIALP